MKTYYEIQLDLCNLSNYEWWKLYRTPYSELIEQRGKLKRGQKCIFNYSDMPVIGTIKAVINTKYKEYQIEFISPFTGEDHTCNTTDINIKKLI